MSVAAGSHIGPYEVIARIGAGGMGEVWRARDPRIGRDVAIKGLPPECARDSVRVRRFEQEARTAGSLNHPNLLTIHDFGTMGPEGSLYIVMEFLEGVSLRERLLGGARTNSQGNAAAPTVAIPPRKSIEIAAQVANGLAAAHEKGLVHRDLK